MLFLSTTLLIQIEKIVMMKVVLQQMSMDCLSHCFSYPRHDIQIFQLMRWWLILQRVYNARGEQLRYSWFSSWLFLCFNLSKLVLSMVILFGGFVVTPWLLIPPDIGTCLWDGHYCIENLWACAQHYFFILFPILLFFSYWNHISRLRRQVDHSLC